MSDSNEPEKVEGAPQKSHGVLYIGMDLGTSRTSVSASNGVRETVYSVVGYPKDVVSQKLLKKDVLFGKEALEKRLSLKLYKPLEKGVIKYTGEDMDIDVVFDLRAIVQQGHQSLAIGSLPTILRPTKGRFALVDYEKVFCPDLEGGQDIFEIRGIDRAAGALVLVRPDQHVAHVLPLDGFEALAAFFERFMIPAG